MDEEDIEIYHCGYHAGICRDREHDTGIGRGGLPFI